MRAARQLLRPAECLLLIVCRPKVISGVAHALMDDSCAKLAEALGRVVRDRRTLCGLSQEAFAAQCGLHRTYIGSIERGERNVTLGNIMRIARALGSTPSEILHEAEQLVPADGGE